MGGYSVENGRKVRWGLVYRAGELNNICPGDKALLESLGIRTVVDFRNKQERDETPDDPLATVRNCWNLPIDGGSLLELSEAEASHPERYLESGEMGDYIMEKLYKVILRKARPQLQDFFALLSSDENLPLLFHCSAGKDRTGIAAALLLTALGAARETVYEDYLVSAACLEEKYRDLVASHPNLASLMTVRRNYLDSAFAALDEEFQGPGAYIRDCLGADTALLRALYTE